MIKLGHFNNPYFAGIFHLFLAAAAALAGGRGGGRGGGGGVGHGGTFLWESITRGIGGTGGADGA